MSKAARWSIIILSIMVCVAGCLIGVLLRNHEKTELPTTEKIEQIQTEIDSIYTVRDSIKERIDTVYIKLENNNKQYEKDVNHVLGNDADEDLIFFRDYINANRTRLDSISNSF